jgi:hypothetical protein
MRERMATKRTPKSEVHKESRKVSKKVALEATPEFHTPQYVERDQAAIDERLAAKYAVMGIQTSEIVVRKNEVRSELNTIQQQDCEEVEISSKVAHLRGELLNVETEFMLDVEQCEREGLSAEETAELDRLKEEATAQLRSLSESLDEVGKKLDIMSGKGYKHFGPHGFASTGWGHGVGNDRCLQCGHTPRHRVHAGPSVRWWKQPDGSYGPVRPEGGDSGTWVVLAVILAALVIVGLVALVMYGPSTGATSDPVPAQVTTPAPAPAPAPPPVAHKKGRNS